MAGALRRQEREPGPRSAAGLRLSRERQVFGSAIAVGMQSGPGTAIDKPAPPASELPVACLEAQNDWRQPETGNQPRHGAMRGVLLSGLAHLAILAALAVWQTAPAELPRGGEEEMVIEVVVIAAEPSLATEAGAKPAEPAIPGGDSLKEPVADAQVPAEPLETRADAVYPAAVAVPETPVVPETKPAEPAMAEDIVAVAPAPEPVEVKVVLPEPPPELLTLPLQETAPDPVAIPKTAEAEIFETPPKPPMQQPAVAAQPVANPPPQPQPAPSFRTAEARVPVPFSAPKQKPLPRPVRAKIAPPEPAETPHKKLVARREPAEAPARPATHRPVKIAKQKPADGEGRGNAGAGREAATRQAGAAGGTRGTASAAGANEIASYRGTVLAHLARFKTYPDSARDADFHGRAVVSFTLTRSGGVTSVSLSGSSGAGILDVATLAMVRRAAPFPAMPAGGPASMSFTAAIRYDLR